MSNKKTGEEIIITENLAHELISNQFPQWSRLTIQAVKNCGWDNRTFHLGPDMLIRMPSTGEYAGQAEKEQAWLPKLAPHLPLSIPAPIAMGKPEDMYPWKWSINRWLPGETAAVGTIEDLCDFARSLAEFLKALQSIDSRGGPVAGEHSFYRGGELAIYNSETRQAIAQLKDDNKAQIATEIWERALATSWRQVPVWVHGDISVGNLLVNFGKLSAVIDFGQLAVGDPACDLAIAWTLFQGKSRDMFYKTLQLDEETWARGRGWTLWKALCWAFPGEKRVDWRVVDEVFADYKRLS
ncbi:MAG: aminoglycoside phosphotransferase family protein [Legionella sp.]|nr:aminoglycoside phosphotransferase family protein [Legionella sp.]